MRTVPGRAVFWVLALAVGLASALRGGGAVQSPAASEFLSRARYLVSNEERKQLLALPEANQAAYIDDFWKKRDTDPASPTNEFKDDYFRRLQQADEMFTGEPQPGWLTERGRVTILYGQPDRRERQPAPAGKTGPCQEMWQYDDFQVVFTDKNCVGEFLLATKDLSPIGRRNIATTSRLRARRELRPLPFDFEVQILKSQDQGSGPAGFVRIRMPYAQVWFDFKDGRFATVFALEMELSDSGKVVRWTFKDRFPASLTAAELEAKRGENFEIVVPVAVEEKVKELLAGKCQLSITMENETSKERVRKVAEFIY